MKRSMLPKRFLPGMALLLATAALPADKNKRVTADHRAGIR
jgi:hypothetical protein